MGDMALPPPPPTYIPFGDSVGQNEEGSFAVDLGKGGGLMSDPDQAGGLLHAAIREGDAGAVGRLLGAGARSLALPLPIQLAPGSVPVPVGLH